MGLIYEKHNIFENKFLPDCLMCEIERLRTEVEKLGKAKAESYVPCSRPSIYYPVIPPKRSLSNNYAHGIYEKFRETLINLDIGEYAECPIEWESYCRLHAKKLGIKIVQRKQSNNVLRIYRKA